MLNFDEVRDRFGRLKSDEQVDKYYIGLLDKRMSDKQRDIINEIYFLRKLKLKHPELPKRDKR